MFSAKTRHAEERYRDLSPSRTPRRWEDLANRHGGEFYFNTESTVYAAMSSVVTASPPRGRPNA